MFEIQGWDLRFEVEISVAVENFTEFDEVSRSSGK